MIHAKLLSPGGQQQLGGRELVKQWRTDTDTKLWLDIEGEVTAEIRELLTDLGCDELAITDSARSRHPPKIEAFANNTFILFRGISSIDDTLTLVPQQVGLWVSDRCLITLHRGTSVSINHFWNNEPADLLSAPNELVLRLLTFACGRYLDHILEFENTLGDFEDSLLEGDSEAVMNKLVAYRSRLRKLRRIFSYHQRMTEHLLHEGTDHLGAGKDESLHLRRDLYDRCERIYSLCSMYYEICGDLVEGYISISSHQLNNTMKVLTIITAIFVPMSFLAGLYGMNFDHMPELHWHYGYFAVLLLMAGIAGGMLLLFRRVKWL